MHDMGFQCYIVFKLNRMLAVSAYPTFFVFVVFKVDGFAFFIAHSVTVFKYVSAN